MPHTFYVWNNKLNTHRTDLFFKHCFQANILLVHQLLTADDHFCFRMNTWQECLQPTACVMIHNTISKHLFLDSTDIVNDKCSNKMACFLFNCPCTPPSKSMWISMFPNIWHVINQYITNKTIKVIFKIIHRIYPAKATFRLNIEYSCSFCNAERKTIEHLFFFFFYVFFFFFCYEMVQFLIAKYLFLSWSVLSSFFFKNNFP